MAKKKSGIMKKLFKLFFVLFLLALLIVGGFAAGVYLQIVDSQAISEQYGLHKLPVVGEYFPAPLEPPTEEEMAEKPVEDVKPKTAEKKEEKKQSRPMTLTKKEIEDQMKEREAAERKRISKLARIYNGMKPQEAADALTGLDEDLTAAILQSMDESSAAKALAKMDTAVAARLTKRIYEGRQTQVAIPSEAVPQVSEETEQ